MSKLWNSYVKTTMQINFAMERKLVKVPFFVRFMRGLYNFDKKLAEGLQNTFRRAAGFVSKVGWLSSALNKAANGVQYIDESRRAAVNRMAQHSPLFAAVNDEDIGPGNPNL